MSGGAPALASPAKSIGSAPRSRDPLPVLYLIPSLGRGGAEGQLITLINRIDRRRVAPILACLEPTSPERRGEIRCEVVSLGAASVYRPSAARGLLRIRGLIRRHRVRVIHAWFFRAEVLAGLSRLLGGRVKVVLAKRDLMHEHFAPHERVLARLSNRASDAIVANAAAIQARLVEAWNVPREKIEVIYNGVDLERLKPASVEWRARARREFGFEPHEPVIVIVTHLAPVKGVDTLLAAAALVARRAPAARFLIVGDGPLRATLEASARSLGVDARIRFAGEVGDVAPYLAAADVGVLSSVSEGLPNALLEYMAMGLPVVSTDVGGVGELLGEDGDCGIRVPARAPDALAEGLTAVIGDPGRRAAMGVRARARAEALFDVRGMVQRYERLYERLTGGGG